MVTMIFSQDNEPGQEKVEKEDWVHGQLFPILRNHLLDEVHRWIGGPHEGECDVDELNNDMDDTSDE